MSIEHIIPMHTHTNLFKCQRISFTWIICCAAYFHGAFDQSRLIDNKYFICNRLVVLPKWKRWLFRERCYRFECMIYEIHVRNQNETSVIQPIAEFHFGLSLVYLAYSIIIGTGNGKLEAKHWHREFKSVWKKSKCRQGYSFRMNNDNKLSLFIPSKLEGILFPKVRRRICKPTNK